MGFWFCWVFHTVIFSAARARPAPARHRAHALQVAQAHDAAAAAAAARAAARPAPPLPPPRPRRQVRYSSAASCETSVRRKKTAWVRMVRTAARKPAGVYQGGREAETRPVCVMERGGEGGEG